ncbi:DICT sensory domain-containing protein [Nocardioides abyssi]|uniref:DICT sensory domain-containing protein n=1 Tax=Nocardioides abyssi TaxID=3058370 RepID=A0ABT8EY88_9ACTN|nr:DICT sensory domain-containing protein [Nocardioides abyssi]MDN4163112.1 DICT sensory domain-containing protein [Nocardioides abyssi]
MTAEETQDEPGRADDPDSVYITVRRAFPVLGSVRVRKRALTAISHALEQEIASRVRKPVLFGGFQTDRFLAPALSRWEQLAEVARACVVFVDPGGRPVATDGVEVAAIDPAAPLREEWLVVCDDDAFACVLSAWEIPGLELDDDGDRIFDLVWSVEPEPTRVAARTCARLAHQAGAPGADRLVAELAAEPAAQTNVRTTWQVATRVLAYLGGAPGEGAALRHPWPT